MNDLDAVDRVAVGLGSIDGGSCAIWSANQCCVRVQAIPAITVTATIVSTTILAVTTEKALTYLTTLSTMNVGACTESVSKRHFPSALPIRTARLHWM